MPRYEVEILEHVNHRVVVDANDTNLAELRARELVTAAADTHESDWRSESVLIEVVNVWPAESAPPLNVRINEADAVVLRAHIRSAHRSLIEATGDGPLPENLELVPNEVLAAVHQANHMVPWNDHLVDNWKWA